jgi:hypothetical protein
MARVTYYVLSDGGTWKVRVHGLDVPFRTQAEAIAYARQRAKQTYAGGQNSQVLIQAANGQWRTEWTYGQDPVRSPG